jgi:hypothetical protein
MLQVDTIGTSDVVTKLMGSFDLIGACVRHGLDHRLSVSETDRRVEANWRLD